MKKFEYKSFTFAYMENDSIAGSDIKVLNKLGAQGWEVIAIAPVKQWKQVGHPENLVAILKREIWAGYSDVQKSIAGVAP